jgi:hypothetical protein
VTLEELLGLADESDWTPGIPEVEYSIGDEEVEGTYILRDHNGSILGEAYEITNGHSGEDNARLWQNAGALWCVLWRLTEALKLNDSKGIAARILDAEHVLTRAVRS